jgi:hypothetical protein
VTDLARIKCFCDGFSKIFVNHKHKVNFGNAPVKKKKLIKVETGAAQAYFLFGEEKLVVP